jgi:hypothetical protein
MDEINPKERRTVIRKPGDTIDPIRLRLEADEVIARVQDISVLGIGLLTRRRLEPGTWLVLEPAKSSRTLTTELRAEVRHSRKGHSEDFFVGCQFSRHLTPDDMMVLGY